MNQNSSKFVILLFDTMIAEERFNYTDEMAKKKMTNLQNRNKKTQTNRENKQISP